MIYWKTPKFFDRIYKNLEWHCDRSKKCIYLTFDDGPTPAITDKVLNILDEFDAKATFFCLGRNVERHPDIFNRIKQQDHSVGNHTYSHLKGWSTPSKMYIHDTNIAQELVNSKLFRPPYGRITKLQVKYLKQRYRIIMWEVLSHDYNRKIPAKMCLRNAIRHTQNGTIIVFHDSEKASKNMLYTLPKYLEHFKNLGYSFESIK